MTLDNSSQSSPRRYKAYEKNTSCRKEESPPPPVAEIGELRLEFSEVLAIAALRKGF